MTNLCETCIHKKPCMYEEIGVTSCTYYSQERPKGRWEYEDIDYFRCSACGSYEVDRTFFCPNCGASMDGADMREEQEPKEEWKKGRYFNGDEYVCPNWIDMRESE